MVGKSKGNKQVNKNAAKDKSTDSSKHKNWRKPETSWAAANQEERVRSRSKKERITCNRGHLILPSPFLSSFPPSQN